MQFKDVIGLSETKEQLTDLVKQNRLSHALLFLGKEGSGALPLALAFAQYVVSTPQAAPVVEDLFGGVAAFTAPRTEPPLETAHRARWPGRNSVGDRAPGR